MKKIFFSMFIFCILTITQGCASSKSSNGTMAVYVTGKPDVISEEEKRVLNSRIVAIFVNSGKYEIVERSDTFLAEIQREHEKQRSGDVDTKQISELGKQYGVQFVFVANVVKFEDTKNNKDTKNINARIINSETTEIVKSTNVGCPLENMDELKKVSNKIVDYILKGKKGKNNNKDKGDCK